MFDPRGGYFKAGGVYMPSIVAEIGAVVEDHLKMIGLMHDPELSQEQKKLIAEKRAAYESLAKKKSELIDPGAPESAGRADAASSGAGADSQAGASASVTPNFPPSASMCTKCQTKAVILMDGCATCLSCGYSKCG